MTASPLLAFGPIGGWELMVIFLIILLLFGAKRLPELARSLGQAKKEFSKATRDASEQIEKLKEIPTSESTSPNDSSKKPDSNSSKI